jgi:hypothetical protein
VVVATLAEKVLLLVLSTVVWYLMSSNLKILKLEVTLPY